jgi:hypothetical protein
MKSLAGLALVIACSTYGTGQNITSITCYRSWTGTSYTSCVRTASGPSGRISCDCAATCGSNCANISASYEVYWAVTGLNTGTGKINGGAQSSAVQVAGSLLLTCGPGQPSTGGSGFDIQNCDGTTTTKPFAVSCGGGN